ncbi:MAG: hypothetical protein IPP37_05450 [Saprospiraceae bacterium]|nr:hypothetical protein [Saprospiraceae bacterium]
MVPYATPVLTPVDAMRTAIAAYTPNLLWFSLEKEPYFQKSGGGTSSATPQVAAAAALYIWKYRDQVEIKREIGREQKIVRQALFRSAETMHNGTYGALYEVQGKIL